MRYALPSNKVLTESNFKGLVGPSIAAYFAGLFFYTTHFPEVLFPGRFDHFNSHALWHVCIIIAIKLHWQAVETLHARAQALLAA